MSDPSQASRARRGLWWIFGLNGFLVASWATRIPAVKDIAGLSVATLGVVLLAPAVGALVAFEVSGRAAARFGSARVTGWCALAFCALLPLVGFADHAAWSLAVALVVFGAGNGALDVAMNTHGVAVERSLGRPALAGMHAAFSAGGFLGAAVGAGAAAAGVGVRTHFCAVAAASAVCAALAGPWLPISEARQLQAASTDPALHQARRGIARIVPAPVLLLGAVAFACMLGEGAAADWSATYLRTSTHTSPGLAAVGYAGFSAAMLAGRLTGDRLRTVVRPSRLLPLSASLAALGLLAGIGAGSTAVGIAGLTAFGAGLALVIPIVFAAAGDLPPRRTGMPAPRALARVSTLGYLGFLAGPPLVGGLASLTSLRFALVLPVILAAAVVPLARPALRRAADPAPEPETGLDATRAWLR